MTRRTDNTRTRDFFPARVSLGPLTLVNFFTFLAFRVVIDLNTLPSLLFCLAKKFSFIKKLSRSPPTQLTNNDTWCAWREHNISPPSPPPKRGRMYALPLRISLPPSKAVTVDIRQELGRGVCGVVIEALIDGRQCALKLVH